MAAMGAGSDDGSHLLMIIVVPRKEILMVVKKSQELDKEVILGWDLVMIVMMVMVRYS